MADAFAHLAGAEAVSAGTVPQERPHPEVVVAMGQLPETVRAIRDEIRRRVQALIPVP